jgi:hypothetical protein
MKNYSLFLLLFLITHFCFGQAPKTISYQGVARNAAGQPIPNQNIKIKLSLLETATSSTALYAETHNPTTTGQGLFAVQIGAGVVLSGTYNTLDWSNGPKFVKTEIDPTGGNNFTLSSTNPLNAVPFALYAENGDKIVTITGQGTTNVTGEYPNFIVNNPQLQGGNGINITGQIITNTGDLSNTNELQTLYISNDTIFLSNGGFAKIPNFGKNTIQLSDDITDAEAAVQISEEVGINTQEIIVERCTNLTNLNVPNIKTAIKITIRNNTKLSTVTLGNLIRSDGDVDISDNPNLVEINLPLLSRLSGFSTKISNNNSLINLNFPSLARVTNLFEIINNQNLSNLLLNNLISFTGQIFLTNNHFISLNFPLLQTGYLVINEKFLTSFQMNQFINGSIIFSGNLQNSITNLSFPSFIKGQINCQKCPLLNSLNLPLLSSGGVGIYNTKITSLTLPSFSGDSSNSSSVGIQNNNLLTSIDFPLLTGVGGINININYNSNLNTISFPLLEFYGNQSTTNFFNYNSLPSSQINYILNKLANCTFLGTGPSAFNLANQNPPAPPTGQGLIDKAALISAGFQVITD